MRTLFSVLVCCSLLVFAAPAITHASTPYFTADGRSSLDGALSHDFAVGQSGGFDLSLVNRGPAVWTLVGGSLPAGIGTTSIAGDVTHSILSLSGMPTTEGTFPVRYLAMVGTNPYFVDFTINTYNPTLTINPIGVAQGRVGLPYLQPLTAGGSSSISSSLFWGISSGALPPGITLNSATGELSGTPTTAGDYRFLVRMNEVSGRLRVATAREYILTIQPSTVVPVRITSRTNPVSGQVGVTYPAQIFRAEGGTGAFTWAITGGSPPPGLTLNASTGILQGTPTVAGTYTFDIKARDASLETNSDSFSPTLVVSAASTPAPTPTTTIITPPVLIPSLPIVSPTPTPGPGGLLVTTASVSNGTVGVDYSTTLSATGGTTPYSWNFASGVLPPGLSLSANGVVSGRPTTAGTYTAYIEVFDAGRVFVGRSITFTIVTASSPAPTTPTPPTTPSTPSTPVTPISPTTSAELTARLNNLTRIGIAPHALVKLPDDGNRFTQADSAVYYIGGDGRRHAFPNDRVFFSWYTNFDGVRVVSASDLASIPLGLNATYKPGVKMVKFTTDPKVYAVDSNRSLRWVKTEAAAIALYGSNWNRQIDDLSDSLYMDYAFGADINAASDYDRAGLQTRLRYVSDTLPL